MVLFVNLYKKNLYRRKIKNRKIKKKKIKKNATICHFVIKCSKVCCVYVAIGLSIKKIGCNSLCMATYFT